MLKFIYGSDTGSGYSMLWNRTGTESRFDQFLSFSPGWIAVGAILSGPLLNSCYNLYKFLQVEAESNMH